MKRLAKALFALGAVAVLLGATSSSTDAETQSEDDRWRLEFAADFWIPEVEGHVTAGVRVPSGALPATATVNEGGLLGGSGHFEARKRRLTLFLNATGTSVNTVGQLGQEFGFATSGKVHSDLALAEVGTAYRIVDWRFAARVPRSFWIDGFAGGRYVHLADELRINTFVISGISVGKVDADVGDPFVGARWSVGLLDNLAWLFSGDVGGFGVGTERTWQLVSTLRYRLPWAPSSRPVWASAGYHLIDVDERGEKIFGRDTRIRLQFRGPIVGLAMQF